MYRSPWPGGRHYQARVRQLTGCESILEQLGAPGSAGSPGQPWTSGCALSAARLWSLVPEAVHQDQRKRHPVRSTHVTDLVDDHVQEAPPRARAAATRPVPHRGTPATVSLMMAVQGQRLTRSLRCDLHVLEVGRIEQRLDGCSSRPWLLLQLTVVVGHHDGAVCHCRAAHLVLGLGQSVITHVPQPIGPTRDRHGHRRRDARNSRDLKWVRRPPERTPGQRAPVGRRVVLGSVGTGRAQRRPSAVT